MGLPHVVPQTDNRLVEIVVLEAKHADAGGPTIEEPTCARWQAQPSGSNHADDMAAGERQGIAIDAAHPSDEAIGSGGDILRRFSTGSRRGRVPSPVAPRGCPWSTFPQNGHSPIPPDRDRLPRPLRIPPARRSSRLAARDW